MQFKHSQEDYLEAILMLSKKNDLVRSVDIAEHVGYTKASISRALSQMVKEELVYLDENKYVFLTEKGLNRAESVYEKHLFFRGLLRALGVREPQATEDACRIEHVISEESFQAIKEAFGRRNAVRPRASDRASPSEPPRRSSAAGGE